MNDHNTFYPFIEMPEDIMLLKECVLNEDLKFLFSNFNFICFDPKRNKSEDGLYDFLKTNKFFVYSKIPIVSSQDNFLYDSILCFENHCLFIESSKINSIKQMLTNENSYFIDLDSIDDKDIKEEILSFCSYFNKEMKSNKFVKLTLKPIAAYTIRKFFLPSSYFKDPSFFSFHKNNEEESRQDFVNFDSEKILKKVSEDRKKREKCKKNHFENYSERDFIRLRTINGSFDSAFYLVIHIKSFYVFLMKKISLNASQKSISHEIDFYNEYSHPYMTPFYGFIKDRSDKITGFVYEFMSNGTLDDYISKNKENIDETFCYTLTVRISKCIKYLHFNSLIHRDIKPDNILIDHNNIPYLSDFDTIRKIENSTSEITQNIGSPIYSSPEQYNGELYTFPSDIYSFGKLISFLYDKILFTDESKMSECIQKVFKKCLLSDSNERPSINEVINFLYNDAKSFYFLEIPFLKKYVHTIMKPEIQQFFKEMYNLLFIDNELNANEHKIELFEILNICNNTEISSIFYSIGILYYDGEIVQQDYQMAKKYFDISAEMNNSDAFFMLGKFYFNGFGVVQDYLLAKKYYKLAVKQNNYLAITNLGYMYENGLGGNKKIQKAKKYYEISSEHDDYLALNNLGVFYLDGLGCEKNYEKAKECFELSAKHNYPHAITNLGVIYQYGNGVEQNFDKAKEYYELAAKQNFPMALNNLGELYLAGYGVEKDCEKAKHYFEIAAKYDLSLAKYNLGMMYKNGLGVAKDYPRARYYFENSSSNDYSISLYQLGKLYYHGRGVKQDFAKAKDYFERSAKQNEEKALYRLGLLYKNGDGIEKNYNKAIQYFELALLHENPKSAYQIGILHFYGLVENHDYQKAIKYFEISSKNNLNSSYYLGLIYENGLGIDRDINKAIEYYKRCANSKNTKYVVNSVSTISTEFKLLYNNFYYQSHNALGLIYITDKNHTNKSLAEDHFKEAGLNEYPFGQNSFGLYCQFYLNQKDKAKHFYENASKSHFAISEYNLGYIDEECGEIENAIEHYSKASDYENDEIIFKNQKIEDERLDISKSFIICYTNLKLSHYYFTRKEISIHEQLCEDLFLNAIFRPIISLAFHSKCHSYSFCFKVIEHEDGFIITNLKDFIIGNPMFHHENELSIESQNSFGWTVTKPKHNDTLELKLLIQKDHEIRKPANKKNNDINLKEKCFEYSKDEVISNSKEIQENDKCSTLYNDENSFLYYQEKIENIFNFMNKQKKYVLIPNKNESINIANQDRNNEIMRIKMIGNNVERYLIYPKKLCEMLIKIMTESHQEIIEIIDQMKTLLYTESYPILFGRISIFEQEEQPNIKEEPSIKEINENFYEGIGDDF